VFSGQNDGGNSIIFIKRSNPRFSPYMVLDCAYFGFLFLQTVTAVTVLEMTVP
jgi:hypothetical protein